MGISHGGEKKGSFPRLGAAREAEPAGLCGMEELGFQKTPEFLPRTAPKPQKPGRRSWKIPLHLLGTSQGGTGTFTPSSQPHPNIPNPIPEIQTILEEPRWDAGAGIQKNPNSCLRQPQKPGWTDRKIPLQSFGTSQGDTGTFTASSKPHPNTPNPIPEIQTLPEAPGPLIWDPITWQEPRNVPGWPWLSQRVLSRVALGGPGCPCPK